MSLDQLQHEAAAVDQELAPPPIDPQPDQAATQPDALTEARGIITVAKTALAPLYPCLDRIYTPATIDRLAEAAAPLMQKYGVSAAGIFDRWGAEIGFAVVALPLAAETVKAIKDEAAERQAATPDEGGRDEPGE